MVVFKFVVEFCEFYLKVVGICSVNERIWEFRLEVECLVCEVGINFIIWIWVVVFYKVLWRLRYVFGLVEVDFGRIWRMFV